MWSSSDLDRGQVLLCVVWMVIGVFPQRTAPLRQWSDRVVSTRLGLTRGYIFLPKGYDGVEVFLGLPYASPPVGSLRLMPPVSGSPWAGTKMTDAPAPVCPQILPSIENETEALKTMPKGRLAILKRLLPLLRNQSEDCLYLNIYVPLGVGSEKTSGLLPVVVFVHGEDYGYGAGHPYDPSMLTSQGQLIVVTMNYRLGILGFLNANSDGYFKSPANFALLDQIAALHWVQENIGGFGGDRSNVTLMGHGKGGIFANFLMISSAVPTGLLFHRVILMSGSALSPIAVGTLGLSNGKDLAKKFGATVKCPSEPPSEMLNCLRQIPLQYFMDSELWNLFGPSEDGVTIEEGLKEPLLRERLSHYPMLFGVTKVEVLPSLSEQDALYGIETDRRREILKDFIEKHLSLHRNEILAAAIHEYTDWERPVQHPISVRDETLDALGDAQIVAPLIKTGDFHSQGNAKSFFYVFEYQSKGSDYQQRLGCIHGEDLLYVFGVPLYFYGTESSSSSSSSSGDSGGGGGGGSGSSGSGSGSGGGGSSNSGSGGGSFAETEDEYPKLGFLRGNFTRNEVQLSQTVIQFWANFIRTGNPNDDGTGDGGIGVSSGGSRLSNDKSISKSKIVEWPHYDPLYKKYLTIDLKPRVRTHYRAHKLSFWLHLVPDLMKNGYGVLSNAHHSLNPNSIPPDSDPSVHNNSVTPPPPTIQLVGPPLWEHNTNPGSKNRGHFFQGNSTHSSQEGGATGSVTHGGQDGDGYQIYSTALSVTIAIGCSLLILNILIFAAFYYQRDKRRSESSQAFNEGNSSTLQSQYDSSRGGGPDSGQYQPRKENGQLQQLHTQMPNICGDLPTLDPDSDPYSSQHTSMSRGNPKRLKTSSGGHSAYEMAMPDAILAAAMMNMQSFSPHEFCSGSPDPYGYGGGPGRGIRRSSLTLKDQIGQQQQPQQQPSYSSGQGCSVIPEGVGGGSKTLPRPPRRSVQSVKFCSDAHGHAQMQPTGDGDGSSSNSANDSGSQQQGQGQGRTAGFNNRAQTLKPSLKKSTHYPVVENELKV